MREAIKPIVMPKWGLAMQEGMVAGWLVEEGAGIEAGEEILDIETSKIANVYESPVSGQLRRQVVGGGETVPVGALLGVVTEGAVSDVDVDAFVDSFREEFAASTAKAAEVAPEPQTIEAQGRRIRYLELGDGDGPAVVFVHGFGGDLNNWQYNQEALAASYRTVALDLPGHGGSSKDVGAGDVPALAAAVRTFLDAKDVGQAHLVGHSLGGAIVLHLVQTEPDRVASATLISSGGLGPEINASYIEGYLQARRRKQLQPVLEMLVAEPEMVSREMIDDVLKFKRLDGVEQALAQIAGAAFSGDRQKVEMRAALDRLAVPVQIIWGRKDRIVPARHAEGLPQEVQVHVLEAAGHMSHMEKAAEVNRLLQAIIDRSGTEAGQ